MRIVAVLGAICLPLALTPGLFFFDDVTPKALILLLLCGCALLLTAWSPPAFGGILHDRGRLAVVVLAGAFVITTLLSTFLSPHPELAWYGSAWRRFGALQQIAVIVVAAAIGAASASSTRLRLWFLRALCVSGTVAGAYTCLQYFGIDPLLTASGYHAGEGPFRIVRPPATLGHSDYLGAFLLWPFFAAIATWNDRNRIYAALAKASIVMSIAGMVLTGARAPLLGLGAGVAVAVYFARPKWRTVAACTLAVVLCATVFYLSPAGERLRARVFWAFDEPAGGARPLIWRDTAAMALQRPLIGVGPENFVAEFPRYQSIELSRAFPDFYHESPHNFVLDAIVSQGLFGALALAGLCAFALWTGWRGRCDWETAALTAALVASLIAHQFTVFTIPVAFCFFTAIALLVTPRGETPPPAPANWVRFVRVAAALVMAAALFPTAVAVGLADHRLAAARNALDRGDTSEAARIYALTLEQKHAAGGAHLYFSRRFATAAAEAPDALSKLRYTHLANLAAARAVADPEQKANALYNYAAFAAIRNDAAQTEGALRAAIAASPNWFKPHWTIANFLENRGRTEEARAEALRAADLNGGKNPEVAETVRRLAAMSRAR